MNLQARFDSLAVSNFRKIKDVYDDAIIAGGAVRDLMMGEEIKDLDVFIGGNARDSITIKKINDRSHWIHSMRHFWRNQLGDTNWEVRENISGGSCPKDDPDVDIVISLFNPRYQWSSNMIFGSQALHHSIPKIDLIFLLKPALAYMKENFDFNICKAMFDGDQFGLTNHFVTDINNRTITLTGPVDRQAVFYSVNTHLPRIKQKYPNFRPVVPQKFNSILTQNTIRKIQTC